ncbi:hypothetical protein ACIA8O_02795 [Kitasatospora sp. NPDC051853]|uniref:hypothetical protein n=1 Tax=Kitasatospora sp. NPDC051853 TaxID=3364058 RepID=UPI0037A55E67
MLAESWGTRTGTGAADAAGRYLPAAWQSPPPLDSGWLVEQPSRLLDARFAVVGFTGREPELASLRAWCAQDGPHAVRWLHGPGGQGKTRLADQLAEEQRQSGWQVVCADGPEPTGGPGRPAGSAPDERAAGLLVLVEQADRRPISELARLLASAVPPRPGVPTRVLLLARRDSLRYALETTAEQPTVTDSQALAPLGPEARDALHRAAVAAFAAQYGVEPPSHRRDLAHPEFGLALTVLLSALDTVLESARTPQPRPAPAPAPVSVPVPDRTALTVRLLDREQAHWALLHRSPGVGRFTTPPWVMSRAVFAAALGGPRASDQAAELLGALDLDHPVSAVLADHALCYPPSEPGRELAPLRPATLAEDFLALTLPGHAVGYPAQPWATGDAAALLGRRAADPSGGDTGAGTDGSTDTGTDSGPDAGAAVLHLALTAARWPHVLPQLLHPLLSADPALAAAGGTPVLLALTELPGIEPELLERVLATLPADPPPDLRPGRAALLVRLSGHRLAHRQEPAEQAAVLCELSSSLAELGRNEEAATAGRRAVELLTALAVGEPAEHRAALGAALGTLSELLERAGHGAEALDAQGRAVEVYGTLAAADPARHGPGLAAALVAHSARLERAGRWGEAHRAGWAAVHRYRDLARRHPGHRAGLAAALSAAGALSLRGVDETDELDPAREAVGLWRELAAEDPAAHRPALAAALFRLRHDLARAGRRAEAVAAAEEGVAVHRWLAATDPERHTAAFAAALGKLRNSLTEEGRHAEAVAAGAEAVGVWRQLAERAPAVHRRSLLGALHGQNDVLRAAGLPPEPEPRSSVPHTPRPGAPGPSRAATSHAAHAAAGPRATAPPGQTDLAGRATGPATPPGGTLRQEWAEEEAAPSEEVRTVPERPSRQRLFAGATGLDEPGAPAGDAPGHQPAPSPSVAVHGWRGGPAERRDRPPGDPAALSAFADRLARQRDWPALWALARSVPVAEAARLARRLPLRRWQPEHPDELELARRLAGLSIRRTADLVAAEAASVPVRLPTEFDLFSTDYLAFAHGRPALAVAAIDSAAQQESVRVLDLERGSSVTLHQGAIGHSAIACLGPEEVVAAWRPSLPGPEAAGVFELVRRGPDGAATVLGTGPAMAGARTVPTRDGQVSGLRLAPGALVQEGRDAARPVDLRAWGLTRGDLLAVEPSGRRLVVSDGARLVAVDSRLRAALATAAVPAEHGEVLDLAFAGPDALVTSGARGGLGRWEPDGTVLRLTRWQPGPLLHNLFAVPAWGVVGGYAPGEGRVHFFDPYALEPAPVPVQLATDLQLKVVAVSPDGRYVAAAGRPTAEPSRRRPSPEWVTLVHDLHHPGALLERPPAGLSPGESAALAALAARSAAAPPRRRADRASERAGVDELLGLAHALATLAADRPGSRMR